MLAHNTQKVDASVLSSDHKVDVACPEGTVSYNSVQKQKSTENTESSFLLLSKFSTKQTIYIGTLLSLLGIYYYFYILRKKSLKPMQVYHKKLNNGFEYEGQLNSKTLTPQGNGKQIYADGSTQYSTWSQGTPTGRSVAKYMQADPLNLYSSQEACKWVEKSILKPFSQLMDVKTQKKALEHFSKLKSEMVWTALIGLDVKVKILDLPLELVIDLLNVRNCKNSADTVVPENSALYVWNHTAMENGMFEGNATLKFESLIQLLGTYHHNVLHGAGVLLVPDKWVWKLDERQKWVFLNDSQSGAPGCSIHGSHSLIDAEQGDYIKLAKMCAEWKHGTLVDGSVQLCWIRMMCCFCQEHKEMEVKLVSQMEESPQCPPSNPPKLPEDMLLHKNSNTIHLNISKSISPLVSPKTNKKPSLKLEVQEEVECTIILDSSDISEMTVTESISVIDMDENDDYKDNVQPSSEHPILFTSNSVPSVSDLSSSTSSIHVFTFTNDNIISSNNSSNNNDNKDNNDNHSKKNNSTHIHSGSSNSSEGKSHTPRQYKHSPYPRKLIRTALPSPLLVGIMKQQSKSPKIRHIPIVQATPKTPKIKERAKKTMKIDSTQIDKSPKDDKHDDKHEKKKEDEKNVIEPSVIVVEAVQPTSTPSNIVATSSRSLDNVNSRSTTHSDSSPPPSSIDTQNNTVPRKHKERRKKVSALTSAVHSFQEFHPMHVDKPVQKAEERPITQERFLMFRENMDTEQTDGSEDRGVDLSQQHSLVLKEATGVFVDGQTQYNKTLELGAALSGMLTSFTIHRAQRDLAREAAFQHCRNVITRQWADSSVVTYGSFPLATSLPYSDVDIAVALPAPPFAYPAGGVGLLSRHAVLYLSEFILAQLQSSQSNVLFPKIANPSLFHPPNEVCVAQKIYKTQHKCCCCSHHERKTVFYSLQPIYNTGVPIIKIQILVPQLKTTQYIDHNTDWCSLCYVLVQVDISFYFTAPRPWLKESLRRINDNNTDVSKACMLTPGYNNITPYAKYLMTGKCHHDLHGILMYNNETSEHIDSSEVVNNKNRKNSVQKYEIHSSKPFIDISYPSHLDFPVSPLQPASMVDRNDVDDQEYMNINTASDVVLQCALQQCYHSSSFLSSKYMSTLPAMPRQVPVCADQTNMLKRWTSPLQVAQSATEAGLEEYALMTSLHSGICSTHVAAATMQVLPYQKPLLISLKALIASQQLHMSFSGGLPPYLCSILCIAFLLKRETCGTQNYVNKVGSVHITEVTGQNGPFDPTQLASLFLEFLYFYGHQFEPETTGVALQSPHIFYALKKQERILTVHDVSIAELVVSSSCFNFAHVQSLFRQTFADLIHQNPTHIVNNITHQLNSTLH